MPYPQIEVTIKYKGPKAERPIIDSTDTAEKVIRRIRDHKTIQWREEAFILCLSHTNQLLGWHQIAIGGMEFINMDTRIINLLAVTTTASSVILTHNHPGPCPKPSNHDIKTTLKIKNSLNHIEVRLLDHIIITAHSHYSMKDHGIL